VEPTTSAATPDNGERRNVDFGNPNDVINLLRQRGNELAAMSRDGEKMIDKMADALAILMFVTAQGVEQGARRIRPAAVAPRIIRG